MSRPRANFYKIDRIEYVEKSAIDPDVWFIGLYVALTACVVGFWLWSVTS